MEAGREREEWQLEMDMCYLTCPRCEREEARKEKEAAVKALTGIVSVLARPGRSRVVGWHGWALELGVR